MNQFEAPPRIDQVRDAVHHSLEMTANSSNEWQNAPVATIAQIDQQVRLEAVEKSPQTVKFTTSKFH